MSQSPSNVRPAPFSLTPQTIAALIDDDHYRHEKMVLVPILPVTLVNIPRPSEDPRLAKSNDDEGSRA